MRSFGSALTIKDYAERVILPQMHGTDRNTGINIEPNSDPTNT